MENVKRLVVILGNLRIRYQVKALAKEYAKDDLEEFKALYKKLADKMLPMVYEVGFLRK